MKSQLVLLEEPPEVWRLDDHTREVGLQGVIQAREVLRQSDRAAEQADDQVRRSAA